MRDVLKKIRAVDPYLLAILAVATIARFWGITFGLPHLEARPDESTVIRVALGFGSGDLNPHFFNYGTLYMYLLFALFAAYFVFGLATGKYVGRSSFVHEYVNDPSRFFLIARAASAVVGVLTVFVLYVAARRLFGRRTALVSSLFMSLAPLHVRDSHFGVTDAAATFLVMCSVFFIIKMIDDNTTANSVLAGVYAGLATSTKYYGFLLVAPVAITSLIQRRRARALHGQSSAHQGIYHFAVAFALCFVAGTPYAFLDHTQFLSDVFSEYQSKIGPALPTAGLSGTGWQYYSTFSLPYGLGWSLLLAGAIGLFVSVRMSLSRSLTVFAFPVIYFLLTGSGPIYYARYAVPLVPFFCLAAAIFLVYLDDALAATRYYPTRFGLALMVILTIMPSAYAVARSDQLLASKDTRVGAAQWINEHLPNQRSIYQSGLAWGDQHAVWFNLTAESWRHRYALAEGQRFATMALQARLDLRERGASSVFEDWTYDRQSRKFIYLGKAQDRLPDYVIVHEHPLLSPGNLEYPDNLQDILRRYRLEETFKSLEMNGRYGFDRFDAFYLPLAGFRGIDRPGPNIFVYGRQP